MARIFSLPSDHKPLIHKDAVLDFFEKRAEKFATLGAIRTVIYQDKNVDLAKRRDAAEKTLLYPMICLRLDDRVLDAGCGTGRWAELLIPNCAAYHGVDISPGLIHIAKNRFRNAENARFTVCPLDEISLEAIASTQFFSKIISFGVYLYLNDDEVRKALHRIAAMAALHARILVREPISLNFRLTLNEHFSDDMEQYYSAVYRTEAELIEMFDTALKGSGFQMIDSGDVYVDAALNNRTETKQRFFLFER